MDASPNGTITVVGHGSASAAPNIATVSIGVETQAATAAEATRRNNERMAAIVAQIRSLGIAEKDLQTLHYSLSLQQERATEKRTARSRYHVSNTLWVKIRDLGRASEILDAITGAGANRVSGPYFGMDEPKALKAKARAEAMEDARACAEDLARLAGVQLGRVLTITENIGANTERAYGLEASYTMIAEERSGPHISAGETEVSYEIQVTFALS